MLCDECESLLVLWDCPACNNFKESFMEELIVDMWKAQNLW